MAIVKKKPGRKPQYSVGRPWVSGIKFNFGFTLSDVNGKIPAKIPTATPSGSAELTLKQTVYEWTKKLIEDFGMYGDLTHETVTKIWNLLVIGLGEQLAKRAFDAQLFKFQVSAQKTTADNTRSCYDKGGFLRVAPLSYRTVRKKSWGYSSGKLQRPDLFYGRFVSKIFVPNSFTKNSEFWSWFLSRAKEMGVKSIETGQNPGIDSIPLTGFKKILVPEASKRVWVSPEFIPGVETGKLWNSLYAVSVCDASEKASLSKSQMSRNTMFSQQFKFKPDTMAQHGRGRSIGDIINLHVRGFRLTIWRKGYVWKRMKKTKTYAKKIRKLYEKSKEFDKNIPVLSKAEKLTIARVRQRHFLLTGDEFDKAVLRHPPTGKQMYPGAGIVTMVEEIMKKTLNYRYKQKSFFVIPGLPEWEKTPLVFRQKPRTRKSRLEYDKGYEITRLEMLTKIFNKKIAKELNDRFRELEKQCMGY